ncbi:hypothetical protein UPYG_G00233170 [Umbra pygmaea]|uniref:Uncharacterized protein n=1 Tax=Umbra pygmaea TaxID=75934 RepID=A0ABD0WIQ2_UMBPY
MCIDMESLSAMMSMPREKKGSDTELTVKQYLWPKPARLSRGRFTRRSARVFSAPGARTLHYLRFIHQCISRKKDNQQEKRAKGLKYLKS